MKRVISFLLVLTMVFGLLGGASLAAFADEDTTDEAVLTVDEDGAPPALPEGEEITSDGPSSLPAGANADANTEGGNDANTEGGNEANTEGGNGANTEGGNEANTEGGNEANTEGGNGANTEGGNEANTEGGNEANTDAADDSAQTSGVALLAADGTEVDAWTVGEAYAIRIIQDGKTYLVVNDNGTVKAAESTDTIGDDALWTVAGSASRASLKNGAIYLYYDSKNLVLTKNDSAKENWSYSAGSLSYLAGGDTYTVVGVSGENVTLSKKNDSTGSGSGSGSSSSFTQTTKIAGLGSSSTTALFVDATGKPLYITDDGAVAFDSALTLSGSAGSYSISTDKPNVQWTVSEGTAPYLNLSLTDKGSTWYLYVTDDGVVTATTASGSYGYWKTGESGESLSYTAGSTEYYLVATESGVTTTTASAAATTIYTLTGSSSTTTTTTTGTTYTKSQKVDNTYAAFVVDGYTFGLSTGNLSYTAVTPADDTLTVSDGGYVKIVTCDGGFYMVVNDPPESTVYLYIDENGALANTDKDGTVAPDGYWTFDKGILAYVNGDNTYYVTGASASGLTIETKEPRPDTVTVYTGSSAPSKDDKKNDSSSSTSTTDSDGPTIVKQPVAVPYVIEGSDYDAPTYTVTAERPEGAAKVTSITFQWFVGDDNHPVTDPVSVDVDENGQATYTASISALKGQSYGVYLLYCKATCTRSDGDHSNNSREVAFIVTKGVKDNTFLTFSDVHQTFTNISYAINDTITVYGGFIPALIICTGDWANNYYSEFKASDDETLATYKETTYNDYILRMAALVGGIDMVYVAGNHDNTSAAEQANLEAGLGVEADGSGVIYDNTNPDAKLGSSANSDDLVVFGINYNDIAVNGGYSYVNVIPELKTFLQGLVDKNYDGVVVISAHAGLHALTVDEMSTATQDGDNDYNIDLSDEVVTMLNDYADQGLTIMFLFGHDHSKGESEFSKVAGDSIVSYHEYKAGTYETLTVKFAYYGHSGYITNTIEGSEKYTVVEYEGKTILSLVDAESNDLRTKVQNKTSSLPVAVEDEPNDDEQTPGGASNKPGSTQNNTKNTTNTKTTKNGSPKTGDDTNLVAPIIVFVTCAMGLCVVVSRKRKNDN